MRNIILLGLTSLLTDISSEMVYPLLPFFLTATLGASPAILGLVEGIAESTASILKVFSGYLSDRFRRRLPLAILGYAGSVAGKVLLVVAGGWGTVLAGRVVDRVGKGVRTAPRDALIAESASPEARGRAFGLHRAMDTAGAAAGVLFAYWLLTTNAGEYKQVFLWSIIPALFGVLILFLVREHHIPVPAPLPLPSFRWSILPRRLRLFLVVVMVFTLGNSSNTFLLLRAHSLNFTAADVLLLYLVYNITYAFCAYPAGHLSDLIGRKNLLIAGYLSYALVYMGFALLGDGTQHWVFWVLFAAYGVYSALTEGVEKALVADLAPADHRATAIGLHATIVGIGLLPASFIAGQVWVALSPEAAFALGGVTGIIAVLGLLLLL
jgi:MFS family permease